VTIDEAARLTPGQKVLYRLKRSRPEMAPATVCEISLGKDVRGRQWCDVYVRREGFDSIGRRYGEVRRAAAHVSLAAPPHDRLSANVYADWLEDNGEPAAAAKLRAAFPIDDGSPVKIRMGEPRVRPVYPVPADYGGTE